MNRKCPECRRDHDGPHKRCAPCLADLRAFRKLCNASRPKKPRANAARPRFGPKRRPGGQIAARCEAWAAAVLAGARPVDVARAAGVPRHYVARALARRGIHPRRRAPHGAPPAVAGTPAPIGNT
jgi:hypothetical protein